MSTLGTAIRGLREAAGLTRADLARRSGVSAVFVGKIEQGVRRPSPSKLGALAQVLGVTSAELLTRAALLEASGAGTEEAMRRALIRAAATGVGAGAARIASMGAGGAGAAVAATAFPPAAAVAAAASVTALTWKWWTERRPALPAEVAEGLGTRDFPDARAQLIELIEALSDEEAEIVLRLARQAAVEAAATSGELG